ncbi:MAG: hypothetical protein M3014_00725 [Chloroflexota bacterium]|nr:hypothetical protein [Chloroflexota bacterium]
MVPELEQQGRPWANPEQVLGLLLVVGVLTWVVWTWWHDTNVSQHYQQAQQAAYAHHWDDALANYSAASGYRDADTRAAEAATQVKKRDNQYRTVMAYQQALSAPQGASAKEAVEALLAARAIQTIEPEYKDTGATIARTQNQLFTDALSGTVLLREQASPPGLYYRGPGGWLYMQGSDRESQVFDTAPEHYIAYDVPGSYNASASATSMPTPSVTAAGTDTNTKARGGLLNKAERHIVLARLSDDRKQAGFLNLHLVPGGDHAYVFGELGVWTLSHYGSPADSPGINGWKYGAGSFVYEVYGGNPVTGTLAITAGDIGIMDVGRHAGRMLVAAGGQMENNRLISRVYATEPDGGKATALYSTAGTLISAQLSPDEHYALIVSAEQDAAAPERLALTANLFDLKPGSRSQGKNAPVIAAQTVVAGTHASGDMAARLGSDFHLGALFLDDGAFKGKLLLGWVEGSSMKLRLVDPSNAQAPLAETSVKYLNTAYYKAPVNMQAVVQSDGQTLLVYNLAQPLAQASNAPGEPFTTLVKLFRAPIQKGDVEVSDYEISLPQSYVPSDKVPYLSDVVFSDAGLVYEITTGIDLTVYGLPVSRTYKTTPAPPTRVLTIPLYSVQGSGVPIYGLKGPRALAYLDNENVLHVRPYNAETDVALESGVSSMVSSPATNFYNRRLR